MKFFDVSKIDFNLHILSSGWNINIIICDAIIIFLSSKSHCNKIFTRNCFEKLCHDIRIYNLGDSSKAICRNKMALSPS